MKKIDFIGIGAEKAGTTWIADNLRAHHEVFVPEKKEIFFFNEVDPHFLKIKNKRYKRGIGWYLRQFKGSDDKFKGELSPTYLYSEIAAKRIKKHFPDIKIIVILRDPVKRVLSQYIHDKRLGLINNMSFEEAIKKHDNYIEKGMYAKHLKKYLKVFDKRQIKIVLLDDVVEDPAKVMSDIYKFLGLKKIDHRSKFLHKRSNPAGKSRAGVINRAMIKTEYAIRKMGLQMIIEIVDDLGFREKLLSLRDKNSHPLKKYPTMSKKTKTRLRKLYRKDIEELEKLIVRSLDKWK